MVVYVIQKSNKYGLKQEIPYKTLKHNKLKHVLERKKQYFRVLLLFM